ncbi:hypothetical protein [Actinophytocola xanthii]|uniref:Uncharacterized protein n=1 Tax=Actinophytocola xanthii TaxID=1912961 RepID=A0A1Q8CMX3_9PSEU|nr:hypothetical protein [Actinophytocola xanthii]OLF15702.1 hypothetical protein BU204_19985 [Actinophytocola xanthii]
MPEFPTSLDKLLELTRGTPYEHLAKDEQALERLFLDTLRTSDDPMLREIGTGIGDGTMTWRTVATHSAYAGILEQNLEKAREFDGGALAAELTAERSRTDEKERQQRERTDTDDSEDLFRGGVLKRRRR